MRNILKSVLMLGSSQVVQTVLSVVRNKILAVLLGPAGVGLFAQLQLVQNTLSSLAPIGMQTGLLRYLALYRAKDKAQVAGYLHSGSKVFGAISLITIALSLIFIRPLANWALDDAGRWSLLVFPVMGVPFLIQYMLWSTYLQAGLEFKAYSKTIALTSLTSLVVVVPLVLIWRERGAAYGLLATAVLSYLIARIYARRSMGQDLVAAMKAATFDNKVLRNLLRFALANLIPTALWLAQPFIVRTTIVGDLGFRANGILQAAFAFYSQYLGMLINIMNTYVTARVCQLDDPKQINTEVNSGLKVSILLNTCAILGMLLIRDLAVRMLFTSKFSDAIELFPVLMIAAYFRFISYMVGISMIPQERFRARNVLGIAQIAVYLAVFFSVPPHMRLQGAIWAEAVHWVFTMFVLYFYMKWLNGYAFDRNNWRLVITSGLVVGAVAFIPIQNPGFRLLGAALSLLWAVTAVNADEWRKLFRIVKDRKTASEPSPEL